ncbi:translation elongation factor Ts [Candidatus Gottesmanbacteria bacterium RIFCSPHIGHO2_01_FULL_42_12]|uniref:Elongation factor Ts n=1 Tax=Candidatus Gottesmanbacteria bacterium RIFCSPHIGHO2_01_FULL_42_12 TaxID=1798377 RepID=A0A1F5Z5I2_9BACT|nr:MAG: translation elongation factor Ts [Candidatus Gottesmanbacteria bacterium RIFCSPHIGHO2_01_FULL_42_12]
MASIDKIKKLRELTGAGIADCRMALEQTLDDTEKALEVLKIKGLEKADKKADRLTGQGKVFSYVHSTGKVGVVVSLLCETDFVAKTQEFNNLGKEICLQIASMSPETVEGLLTQEYIRDPKLTISDMIKTTVGKLGENIKVGEFNRIKI